MPSVVAIDNLKPDKAKRTERVDGVDTPIPGNITFFRQSIDTPVAPNATLNLNDIPGRWQSAHFHEVDQFQIIVRGKGKLGRHDVSPYCVHFARAYTPYGPLRSDKEVGWTYLTLRMRYNAGKQVFPESQDKLKQIPNRRPWQVYQKIAFPAQGPGITLQDVPEIKDEQGLFVHALTMAPRTRTVAPDPSGGDGQFVVVFKGSLVHDNREHNAMAVAFVKPVEDAFHIHAGAQGLEALILNFPQVRPRAVDATSPSTAAGFKKWQCVLCAFAYDEALGMPEDGIPAGTRWQDVSDTWSCPDCSASKGDFQMVEV
jgi:rubredoxin